MVFGCQCGPRTGTRITHLTTASTGGQVDACDELTSDGFVACLYVIGGGSCRWCCWLFVARIWEVVAVGKGLFA